MREVLFVCTGNTCRSPMAELYFNDYCHRCGIGDLTGCSAGIMAFAGDLISDGARQVMEQFGIASCHFRSRRLSPYMVDQAEIIVPMSLSHLKILNDCCPLAADKTHLLLEFSGVAESVPDPYGGDILHYQKTFAMMRPALEMLAESLSRHG